MTNDTTRKASLTSIARELGISAKTVSNAFNRPDQLSAELRERILEVARNRKYPGPDPLAQAFRRGSSGMAGVLYANRLSYAFADPAAVSFLAGFSEVIEPEGMGLTLIPGSAPDHRDAGGFGRAMIDGVVAYSLASDDPVLEAVHGRNLPLVTVDQPRLSSVPWVGIDDRARAEEIGRHLVDLGHRSIGIVSFGVNRSPDRAMFALSDPPAITLEVSRRRLDGYRKVLMQEAGIQDIPVMHMADSTGEEGEAGTRALLEKRPDLTAVICLSDRIARGAITALKHMGLGVPGDVSVAGFDDAYPADGIFPSLTTVSQPHRQKGETAARLLLASLGGDDAPAETLQKSALVVRDSTAPPGPPRETI